MFRSSNFDKLLDKATSNLRLDPDWPTILQICDLIRQNDCSPKYAITAIKKKLYSRNPHQAMFGLLVLESIVKNCGATVHEEVTSKAFCETLRDLVKTTPHENLKSKVLELIQDWAFAFRNTSKYRAVQDTVNILKAEGHKFPPLKESDAMFSADTAPEWADGEVCHRCRVAFSLILRRHHCRACGQVFCQQCSSKTSTLPKFGIEKEVRVCDACFDKVSRPPPANAKTEASDTSSDNATTTPQQKKPSGKSAEELQEEEELQLALALSQSEAEQKEKERKSRSYVAPEPAIQQPIAVNSSPARSAVSASPDKTHSELSRYLDRSYWEQRAPTAPASSGTSEPPSLAELTQDFSKPTSSKTQEEDAEDKELDDFVGNLKSQVEIFVNRMKSNSSRGRSIANDSSVQTLFMNITAMHSRLLRYIQQQDDKRVYLESLQDKVSQVRDSRAALDTLRLETAARRAAEAERADRQRQALMAAKLHAMRRKKHEYLQYQRQLALQRVQEQEREMQMRQEQQKHMYLQSSSGNYFLPPGTSIPTSLPYQNAFLGQQRFGNPHGFPGFAQTTTEMAMTSQSQPVQAGQEENISQPFSLPTQTPLTYSISHQLPMQYKQMQMRMGLPGQSMPNVVNGMPQQQGLTKPTNSNQIGQPMPYNNAQTAMMQNILNNQANQKTPVSGYQINPQTAMSMTLPGQPLQNQNSQLPVTTQNIPTSNQGQVLNHQSRMLNQQMLPQVPAQHQIQTQQLKGQPLIQGQPQLPNQMQGHPQMQNQQPHQMQGQSQMQNQQPHQMHNQPQIQGQPQPQIQGQQIHGQVQGQHQMHGPQSIQGQQQIPAPGQIQQSFQLQPGTHPGQLQQPTQMQHPTHIQQPTQMPHPGHMQQPNQMPQQQIPQQMQQQQQMPQQQPQQMPQQQQQMPQQQQQMPQQQQQMPQQQQQMPQQQQQMPQHQHQMAQQQQMPQQQQQQQMPQQPQMQQIPQHGKLSQNLPPHQPQTPIKSEPNKTAELISFD